MGSNKRENKRTRRQHKDEIKDKSKTRSSRHEKKQEKYDDIFSWWKFQLSRLKRDEKRSVNHTSSEDETTRTGRYHHKSNDHRARSDRHNEKQPFKLSITHIVLSFGAVFVLALVAYTVILYGGKIFVDEDRLVISPPTTIETVDGDIIWYLYDEYRLPVTLEKVPKHVQDAFVSIEDKRFYNHSGVDIRSVMRAIYRDVIARDKVEGASTITQQLAKNLFLTNEKTWLRKTKEVMIALYLEREFTKDEILEMYLNVVYFGQGQYGIEAAANKFFYKSVEELTIEEGALLAGILKAPNGYSPIEHEEKALERRNLVLYALAENEHITEEEAEALQEKDLGLNVSQRRVNPAYHSYVQLVIDEAEEKYGITSDELKNNRYKIVTGMNETAQEIAFDQFRYDAYFPGNNMEEVEGAFVMMDQASGEIVAAIAGRDFQLGHFNRVTAQRQPGSTFKPLAVFAPAMESESYTPYSILPDEQLEIDGHQIRNYNNQYEGSVTLYEAVRNSKNTSTVWLYEELGYKYVNEYLKAMNMDIANIGYNIALGGLDYGVTPIQLVEGYRTFLQDGEMIDSYTISEIYDRSGDLIGQATPETTKVFSSQVAWNMTEMLTEVVRSGTAQRGSYPHALAGKTGTTQHDGVENASKDAWFVGMTPDYITALWMGYDKSEEGNYLTGGSSYPTELTKKILTELDAQEPLTTTFSKPEHVQALAEPVDLPLVSDLESSYVFGGLKLVKGKLEWTGVDDERIVYQIFEEKNDGDEKIGEVVGTSEFVIEDISIFRKNSYYIVPYDPVANIAGEKSNAVYLTF